MCLAELCSASSLECEATPCFPWQRKLLSLFTRETHTPSAGNDNKSFQRATKILYRPGSSPQPRHLTPLSKAESWFRKTKLFAAHSTFQGVAWTCAMKFAFPSTCIQPRFPRIRYNASSSLRRRSCFCCCCCHGVHPEKREMQAEESSLETKKSRGLSRRADEGWGKGIGVLRGFAPLTNEPGGEVRRIHSPFADLLVSAPGLSIRFFPRCLWFVFLYFPVNCSRKTRKAFHKWEKAAEND